MALSSLSLYLGKTETKLENMKNKEQTSKGTSGKSKGQKAKDPSVKSGARMVKGGYIVVLLVTFIAFTSIRL